MNIVENENNDNTDVENITKVSQKKTMLAKSNKVKSDKQILQWENAQKMRLRKAELKRQKDDETASIRNENNKLKKQIAESVVSKKNVKKKKAIIVDASAVSESDSESDSEESDASAVSDSESEEEDVPKLRKRQKQIAQRQVKILKPTKCHRMINHDSPEDKADYSHFFI